MSRRSGSHTSTPNGGAYDVRARPPPPRPGRRRAAGRPPRSPPALGASGGVRARQIESEPRERRGHRRLVAQRRSFPAGRAPAARSCVQARERSRRGSPCGTASARPTGRRPPSSRLPYPPTPTSPSFGDEVEPGVGGESGKPRPVAGSPGTAGAPEEPALAAPGRSDPHDPPPRVTTSPLHASGAGARLPVPAGRSAAARPGRWPC